jgi:hypothetical protein
MDTGDVLRFAADVPHEHAALGGQAAGAMPSGCGSVRGAVVHVRATNLR